MYVQFTEEQEKKMETEVEEMDVKDAGAEDQEERVKEMSEMKEEEEEETVRLHSSRSCHTFVLSAAV